MGVAAHDHVPGAGRQRRRRGGLQGVAQPGHDKHVHGAEQEPDARKLDHDDQQVHLRALPGRILAEAGRRERLDNDLEGLVPRPRPLLPYAHSKTVRPREERGGDDQHQQVVDGAARERFHLTIRSSTKDTSPRGARFKRDGWDSGP